MPAVSGSPTQEMTTQPNVAALESVEVASMGDGDLAHVQDTNVYYVLDVESVLPRDGVNVLWTRNTDPLYTPSATVATPGRWLLFVAAPGGGTGATGPSFGLLSTFGSFYSITPPNTAVIAPGFAMDFPFDGPADGIARSGTSQFFIAVAGVYEVAWEASIVEPGQMVVALDSGGGPVELPQTLVGRDTQQTQIVGNTLITIPLAGTLLSIRNPTAGAGNLTRSTTAGATGAGTSTLSIKRIA